MPLAQTTYAGILDSDVDITVDLDSGITSADLSKALAFNASTGKFKLAVTGDIIRGRLEVVEDRGINGGLVGTMRTKGGMNFLKQATDSIALGSSITCLTANPGYVTQAAADNKNLVVAVGTNYATVLFNV